MSKEKKERGLNADQTNPGSPEDAKKFSEMVYQAGGIHRGPRGKMYSFRGVSSKEELEEALSEGWFLTLGEALNPSLRKKAPAKVEEPSEFTSEDYYNLYAQGKSNKEITELTGNKSPWMSAKSYAEANQLPYPPEKKD